jgi:hypothetical protein
MIKLFLCVFVFSITTMPMVGESIIFSNFGPGLSYNTAAGNPVGNAFDGNNYAEANVFTTGSGDYPLESMQIALSCSFVCSDPFRVTLSQNSGGKPGAAIETFTLAPSLLGPLGSNNTPLLLTSVLNPVLTGGTLYWVTVSSDLNDSIAWNWNSTGDRSPQALSPDGGITWFVPSGLTPGAFQVTLVTPEPGTWGLLLGAGMVFGALKKRSVS